MSAETGWGSKKLCSRKETREVRVEGRLRVKTGEHSCKSSTMRVRLGWAVARAMASWPPEPPICGVVLVQLWRGVLRLSGTYVDNGCISNCFPI